MHELHETRPPKFRDNELASFKVTWVTGSLMVVATGKDGVMERILQGDIDMTLVGQDMVIKFPVREAGPEGGGDIFQG